MNNIEKITGKILADAQAEADRIAAEAEARCREIEEKSEADAQEAYWQAVRLGTDKAKVRRERLMSVAELEAKKQILRAKQELVTAAFTHAADKLRQLPQEAYVSLLAMMAAAASETGREEIVLSARDRETVGAAIVSQANAALADKGAAAGLTLSQDTRETGGGLILRNGNIEMNCTFDAVVNERKNEMTAPVARVLFD